MLRFIHETAPISYNQISSISQDDRIENLLEKMSLDSNNSNDMNSLYELFNSFERALYIARGDLEVMQSNFEAKYFAQTPGLDPEWNPDIAIDWSMLVNTVTEGVSVNDEPRLALNFIFCFDDNIKKFYLTVRRYLIDFPSEGPVYHETYSMSDPELEMFSLFQTKDGSGIGSAPDDLKRDDERFFYHPKYFSSIGDENGDGITFQTHAQSITFAWEELKRLYERNNNNGKRNIEDFSIVFRNISYNMGEPPYGYESLVQWPHAIAMIMRHQGNDCLNNISTVLINKAGDLGGICPPRYGIISWQLT